MLIYYCDGCKVRIPPADFESNAALMMENNKPLCAACAFTATRNAAATAGAGTPLPVSTASSKSQKAIRPATGVATIQGPSETGFARGKTRSSHLAAIAPATKAVESRRLITIVIGACGFILVAAWFLFTSGRRDVAEGAGSKDVSADSGSNRSAPIQRPVQTSPSPQLSPVVKPESVRAPSEIKTAIPKNQEAQTPAAKPVIGNDAPRKPVDARAPDVDPPKTPAPLVKPEAPPGMQELGLGDAASVCKLLWSDFKGGGEYHGFGGKDKASKAIWGKNSTRHTLTATFDLRPDLYDAGTIVVLSLYEARPEGGAHIAFVINGQEAFNGKDSATAGYSWSEQRYPIPAGVLKAGKNEIQIKNLNDTSVEHAYWYMIHSIEILAATRHTFPPVVAEAKHITIKTCDSVEALIKKDFDLAAKLDQALSLAKGVPDSELQPLVNVLDIAQTLYTRALDTVLKTPPADEVQIEKPKLRGKIVRITDGKVFIQSQGVEFTIDMSALPQSVYMKTLAFNESKPADAAQKAAYLFGLGNIDAAQQLLKRLKKEDLPAWAVYFDVRTAQKRLLKFEAAVNELEAAMKNSKTSVLPALQALEKEYPDLIEANAERIRYLTTVAEQMKK